MKIQVEVPRILWSTHIIELPDDIDPGLIEDEAINKALRQKPFAAVGNGGRGDRMVAINHGTMEVCDEPYDDEHVRIRLKEIEDVWRCRYCREFFPTSEEQHEVEMISRDELTTGHVCVDCVEPAKEITEVRKRQLGMTPER